MTREEAIAYGKRAIDLGLNDETQAFCELAIKALEQESVIDKIRAEIVDLGQRAMNDNRANGIWACRDIIDKYRAENQE